MTAWSERHRQMLRVMGLRVWGSEVQTPAAPEIGSKPMLAAGALVSTKAVADSGPTKMPTRPTSSLEAMPPKQSIASSATPVAGAGLAWAPLRAAVADCRACPLCEGRTQTVFGSGHQQAHWLIVGDAPGAEEDAAGEPFVGAAGQLMDNMLAALGLSRQADGDPGQRAFLVNAVKCRPPPSRSPQAQDIQLCAPFLQQQIELVQPKVIVAMGRLAAQALLSVDAPLGQLRGQVHTVGGKPLVVTYHPSSLLRSPTDKSKAWADLCLAAGLIEKRVQLGVDPSSPSKN